MGFETAFKGKGPNSELLQSFYKQLYEKQCTFIEGRFPFGGDIIKDYILKYANNTDYIKFEKEKIKATMKKFS